MNYNEQATKNNKIKKILKNLCFDIKEQRNMIRCFKIINDNGFNTVPVSNIKINLNTNPISKKYGNNQIKKRLLEILDYYSNFQIEVRKEQESRYGSPYLVSASVEDDTTILLEIDFAPHGKIYENSENWRLKLKIKKENFIFSISRYDPILKIKDGQISKIKEEIRINYFKGKWTSSDSFHDFIDLTNIL